jgi:hypothetical protein
MQKKDMNTGLGKLWYVFSGAANKAIANPGYYANILEKHKGEPLSVAEDIETVRITSVSLAHLVSGSQKKFARTQFL